MQPLVAAPASWRLRLLGGIALLLACAALAAVVAHGLWRLLLPAEPPAMPESAELPARTALALSPPFGVATARSPDVPAGVAATALAGDLRLLGVFAGPQGRGEALFRLPERGAVLVAVGQAVVNEVTLDAVFPDRVQLTERGETRSVLLRPASPSAAATVAASAATVRAPRSGCTAPAGFVGDTYRINAELLSGMAAQSADWKRLLDPTPSGITVREGGGFAALLGLKPGDQLREANGIRLTAASDILAAVVNPLQANQPVRVKGTRAGKDREFLLVNASACQGASGR